MSTGRRQGTSQIGFHICPHTCGCIITQRAINLARRTPSWLRLTPIAHIAGDHLPIHIKSQEIHPNCGPGCQKFAAKGRPLTDAEYTAWVPHLGHWPTLHQHIPTHYHHLFPSNPLGDNYNAIPPPHPLPISSIQNVQQGMAAISFQPQAGSSSSNQPEIKSKPKLLFVESPRTDKVKTLEDAKMILTYDTFLVHQETPKPIIQALRTAPPGLAFLEHNDGKHPNVDSYLIHDLVSFLLLFEYSYLRPFPPDGLGDCIFKCGVDTSVDEMANIPGHRPWWRLQAYSVHA